MDPCLAPAIAPAVATAPPPPRIQQLDCIVLDVSASMKSKTHIDPDMTREDLSKLVFHTMVDKLLCLEMDHAVGLVSFGADIAACGVTRDYEAFHTQLGRLDASQGRTRLFDAIAAAADSLRQYRQAHADAVLPDAPLRVFALTDGEDNASAAQPWAVASMLQTHGIVLDVFPLACRNAALHAVCLATGGQSVDVTSVAQGTARFEDETLLHVASRPEGARPAPIADAAAFAALVAAVPALQQSQKQQPQQAASTNGSSSTGGGTPSSQPQPQVTRAAALAAQASASAVLPAAPSGGLSGAVRRLMREFHEAAADGFAAFVAGGDVHQWKVVLPGPDGSPYAGGSFVVALHFPADYPFRAPKVRCLTPVYHCNINDAGSVCLDILKDSWSPALTALRVLLALQALLAAPNPNDPLDSVKATVLREDAAEYARLAARARRGGRRRWRA
jgi:ubiquitin-conjugating enzyme E2 D/E